MTNFKIRWGERIPELLDHADQLLNLANEVISASIKLDAKNDTLGLMIASFTHKQIYHLKSICILVKSGQYKDAEIICRSSVEGMYLLLWSTYGPKDNPGRIRPLCWAAHDGIDEYRRMIESDTEEIDLKTETAIFDAVKEYGYLLRSEKSKKNLRQGKPLPDFPYIKRWPEDYMDYREIVKELEDLGLLDPKLNHYDGVYRGFSQWLHWTPGSFKKVFDYDENRISQNLDHCKFVGSGAITLGLYPLATSLNLFNDHFKLNFQNRLIELSTEYNQWVSREKSF